MDEGERQRHWEKDRHPGDCEVHLRDRLTLDGFSYTIPQFWHLKLKTQSYYESPYGPDSPPLSILPWGLLRPCPPASLSPPCRHWLSSAYTQFAVPYFIYDIYAMFLCHWHKHQVKGHGGEDGTPRALGSTWAVVRGYLHKEFLMVLHHAAMVLVCFPLSVVSPSFWSQETWVGDEKPQHASTAEWASLVAGLGVGLLVQHSSQSL